MEMNISIDIDKVTVADGKIIIDVDPNQKGWIDTILMIKNGIKLSDLKPKDEFKIGDDMFIVLEQTENGTKVISKEFAYTNKVFGNCSDWKKSPVRTLLNGDYYNKIAKLVGASNIISMERDLTSLDGLDDYGTCNDKISLLSVSEYVKYHKILGFKFKYTDCWWTITSASAPCNGYTLSVCYVRPSGVLDWHGCDYCDGVRPFLNLKSSILVSLNKD